MDNLGKTLRKLREEKKLPLRTVAAYLDIDQAILSKIERGQRKASREQVVKLARFFKISEDELLVSWLSDKLVYAIADETLALKALRLAEEKVNYLDRVNIKNSSIINAVKSILKIDGRISNAWLFGSFARKENVQTSDVDIMIELNKAKKYSMFDLLDIKHKIEIEIKRKVDLVEKGSLKDFALNTAYQDLIKIYG